MFSDNLEEVSNFIMSLYKTKEQEVGKYKNTYWRMTGRHCDVDISGHLQLAEGSTFDRWANSVTIDISIWGLLFDELDPIPIIKKSLEIYS